MKLPPRFARFLLRAATQPHEPNYEEILRAFPSETDAADDALLVQQPPPRHRASPGRTGKAGVLILAVAALAGVAVYSRADVQPAGTLRVESDPTGALVQLDGRERGTTPLALTLAPGRHSLVLERDGRRRTTTADVAEGATTVHHIELPPLALPAASAPATGRLDVLAPAAPATVIIDGVSRGQAPVTLGDIAAGSHEVRVTTADTTYLRTVVVQPGATASLMIGAASNRNASGWLAARTPLPLQVLERGRVVGTTESDRIMLPVGEHDFEFVSQSLGFRTTRRVTIVGGKETAVTIALPQAPLHLNATPWAEVWIDGVRIGETPIANLLQPIGPHEIVFRHPQLGERRVTATVTLDTPARAAVDMRTR